MSGRRGNDHRQLREREPERREPRGELQVVLRQRQQAVERQAERVILNNPPAVGGAPAFDLLPAIRLVHREVTMGSRNNLNGTGTPSSAKRPRTTTYGAESVESWASTEIDQETFSFLWNIRCFGAFTTSEEVKSPTFRGGPKSNHVWQLKMNPKKKCDDLDYFSVHLILVGFGDGDTSSTRKLKVRFQISLIDPDGRPGKQAGSAIMNVCEFKKCSVWGYDKFILAQDLTQPSKRLVEDDQLKVHCRIWIEGELRHKTGNGGAFSYSLTDEEKISRRRKDLADDFRRLWKEQSYVDVSITTPNKVFSAHKSVLACRSSVFAAMFQTQMTEAAKSNVEISEFDDDVVEAMLEYMYTGETDALTEKSPDLLQIAEKYHLPCLKEDCEYTISENLTVENAAEVLVMAHLYNAAVLKPRVIEFINRNKEDVKKTEAFQQVASTNAPVFVELYLSQ